MDLRNADPRGVDLRDQVVVVAGATGRVGSWVCRMVLAGGGKVAAAVRKPWQVGKLQHELGRERLLVGLVPPLDTEAAAGFAKGANDALGPVTSFVGAAGSFAPRQPGREPGHDLAELLEANLLANATLARALLPGLRRRRRGTLAFVGAGPTGLATGSAAFAAAKEALHGYVRSLAIDLEGTGIVTGVVLPTGTATSVDGGVERTARALLQLCVATATVPGVLLSAVE